MKILLLAILSLCFSLTVVVALSQDAPNQAPKTQADARGRLTTIMGTVEEGGDKLRFVTEQRAWKVDNPEILEGHEGHYVPPMPQDSVYGRPSGQCKPGAR